MPCRWHCSGVRDHRTISFGGQYCSADYQALLKRHNLRGSMIAKDCCFDHACEEIFFHSLKVECIHGELFISWETIRATVFSVYNRWRRHSGCGALVLNNLKTRTSLRAVHITWVRSPLLTVSGRKETELI